MSSSQDIPWPNVSPLDVHRFIDLNHPKSGWWTSPNFPQTIAPLGPLKHPMWKNEALWSCEAYAKGIPKSNNKFRGREAL